MIIPVQIHAAITHSWPLMFLLPINHKYCRLIDFVGIVIPVVVVVVVVAAAAFAVSLPTARDVC